MKISVIIPVYNAEKFIRNAVQSALNQPETAEVLLIEDCSPDNSLRICRELEEQYEKVRLLRHPDGKNHGAGATRTLGIKNAKYDYIAFLDADDFYLPERFKLAQELFEAYDDIDGVYEATGVHFYDPQAERKLLSGKVKPIMTMKAGLNAEHLFEALARGKSGFFHLDGLVVKRNLFEHCGYFFEHLKLHQDTAIIIQMSNYGKLIPGQLNKPVAMRTVHDQNRILNQHDQRHDKFLYWKTLFYWARERKLSNRRLKILYHNYILSMYSLARNNSLLFPRNLQGLKPLFVEPSRHPFWFITGASRFFFGRFVRYTYRFLLNTIF